MIGNTILGTGLASSKLGLGCMGMSEFYVASSDGDPAGTIEEALMQGITMFDTADMYGPFSNEILLGSLLKTQRQRVVIASKFGYLRDTDGKRLGLNGRPEYVRSACEASLRRLGTTFIDLYYLHRVDREVPIEETVGAMSRLVEDGKVRHLGLSEVSAATLRRAHSIHPISAVQSEYSLVSREPEAALFETLHELDVGFVAYAPLGRGLLTGRFRGIDDVPPTDYRRTSPRFAVENLGHNVSLVAKLEHIASTFDVTAAQLALAWVASKVSRGVVLVGTTSRRRLMENVRSMCLHLPADTVDLLDSLFYPGVIRGDRYPDMSRVNG